MRKHVSSPFLHHSSPMSHMPTALDTAASVYIRHDARCLPLQRPYDGPFAVLQRGHKAFVVSRNGQPYSVSVDHLKPAVAPLLTTKTTAPRALPVPRPDPAPDLDQFPEAPLRPSTTTCSGRLSKPLERYEEKFCRQ